MSGVMKYTKEEIANGLEIYREFVEKHGKSQAIRETTRVVGVSDTTFRRWLAAEGIVHTPGVCSPEKRYEIAQELEQLMSRGLRKTEAVAIMSDKTGLSGNAMLNWVKGGVSVIPKPGSNKPKKPAEPPAPTPTQSHGDDGPIHLLPSFPPGFHWKTVELWLDSIIEYMEKNCRFDDQIDAETAGSIIQKIDYLKTCEDLCLIRRWNDGS